MKPSEAQQHFLTPPSCITDSLCSQTARLKSDLQRPGQRRFRRPAGVSEAFQQLLPGAALHSLGNRTRGARTPVPRQAKVASTSRDAKGASTLRAMDLNWQMVNRLEFTWWKWSSPAVWFVEKRKAMKPLPVPGSVTRFVFPVYPLRPGQVYLVEERMKDKKSKPQAVGHRRTRSTDGLSGKVSAIDSEFAKNRENACWRHLQRSFHMT